MRQFWFVAGAVLVVLGVIALLNSFFAAVGLHFRVGWVVWPLLLIGAGVWIIMGFPRGRGAEVSREQASVPLEGATAADVTVRHGAGRLSITGGAGSGELLSGTFGGGLDASRRVDNGRLSVDMRVRDRDVSHYVFGPWGGSRAGLLDWDMSLAQSVPLALHLETGASETRLDLGDLQVRELSLKTGASATVVDLPRAAGFTKMKVESGAASVRIRVPEGVAASILVKSALAGIHVNSARFPRAGSAYTSPDYKSAANRVEIYVETGVGSIDIS